MSIDLQEAMDLLQTLIIKSTTDISNNENSRITCTISSKINDLIDTQTIGNKIKQNSYMK